MREQHPIDDLFRRVLSDAETPPPPAVWEGVKRRRHWGHCALLQLERRWGWALLLLLLLGVTPAAFWARRAPGAPSETATAFAAPVGAEPGTMGTANARTETPAAQRAGPATSQDVRDGVDEQPVASARKKATSSSLRDLSSGPAEKARVPETKSGQVASSGDGRAAPEHGARTVVAIALSPPEPTATAVRKRSRQADEGTLLSSAASQEKREPERTVGRELGRRVTLARSELATPEPDTLPQQAPYVLAHGNYWFGLQVSLWNVNGHWSGPSSVAEALDNAEEWHSQQTLAALFGHRWRSGFSVGTGVELTKRDSRFLVDRAEPGTSSVVVDTAWTVIPMGTATFYSWNIDSTMMIEPGAEQHYSATNQYTMARIPIELGWSNTMRRWMFSVRGGASINFPIARSGQTIAPMNIQQDPPGSSGLLYNVIDLDDASVDDRFGVSLSAFGNLDLGYMLTERWSAHVGPSLARDFGTGNTPLELKTTQAGGFFRVEYELRTKERRAMNARP